MIDLSVTMAIRKRYTKGYIFKIQHRGASLAKIILIVPILI